MTYVQSQGSGKVKMIVQPKHGSSKEFVGNYGLLEKFFNNQYMEFYVCKGAKLITRNTGIIDKFADFLENRDK